MANFTIKSVFEAVDRLSGPVRTMRAGVDGFSKSAAKSMDGVKKMAKGAAIATAAVAAAGVAGYKIMESFAGKGDDIARNAGILGLSAEAYQELAYAANMADVEQEAFTSATKKLNNSLGQLQSGQGALYSSLKTLNPQLAAQLKTAKSTDDAFMMVSKAIAAETNVQKKATLAQAAFGKTGQDLIPMMEGLAAARKDARDAGAIMSEKEIAAASRMDDALKKIKISAGGALNSALGAIAEQLAPIIENLTAWVRANKEMIAQNVVGLFNGIVAVVKILAAAWNSGLLPALFAGVLAFKTMTGALMIYKGVLAAFKLAQAIATGAQIAFNVALTDNPIGLIIVGISALIAIIVLLVKNWDAVQSAIGAAWTAMKTFAAWIWSGLVVAFQASIEFIKKNAEMFLMFLGPIGLVVSLVKNLAGAWGSITKAFKDGGILAGIKEIGLTIARMLVKPMAQFLGLLSHIPGVKGLIAPAKAALDSFVSGGDTPVSPQSTTIESRKTTESRSQVDVNFGTPPPGTTISQRGGAPGVTIRQGYAFSGGVH